MEIPSFSFRKDFGMEEPLRNAPRVKHLPRSRPVQKRHPPLFPHWLTSNTECHSITA